MYVYRRVYVRMAGLSLHEPGQSTPLAVTLDDTITTAAAVGAAFAATGLATPHAASHRDRGTSDAPLSVIVIAATQHELPREGWWR